jgi:xanthine dehydrogenase small subunit
MTGQDQPNANFSLNGVSVSINGLDHNTTLLNFIRASGLTGTKEGCAEGDCGACTVAVLTPDASGKPVYQAVNSCLMLAGMVVGLEVFTAEGIGHPEAMHAVQSAMSSAGGSQCGYCTPGFVMSMFAENYAGNLEFDEAALVGNLCRCTGYRPIREAAHALPKPSANDKFLEHLKTSNVSKSAFSVNGFHRPDTLTEALHLFEALPNARVIAGGTDMALEITTAFKKFENLISLDGIPELLEIRESEGFLEIGAGVSLSRLETELRGRVPLLDELWIWFASRQIRNRATLGGNLGTASPIGDAPVVLLALEAELMLVSSRGERTVPLSDYFLGYRKTMLQTFELIKTIRIPLENVGVGNPVGARHASPLQDHAPKHHLQAMYKIAKRGHDDISTVMAAFHLETENDVVTKARLAFGGVAATPIRALETEQTLIGQIWNRVTLEKAKKVLALEFKPITDARASASYRARIIVNLLEKFWLENAGVNA